MSMACGRPQGKGASLMRTGGVEVKILISLWMS